MDTQFLESIFVDGIQHPNFFNGRILTATDLRDEQKANLRRSHYLGQALGSGVVSGLEVKISPSDGSALEITEGLAINPRGETLALPVEKMTLHLTVKEQLVAASSSPFAPCSPPAAATSTGLVPTNYYLLALASATKFSETNNALHSGLGTSNNRCTSRYEEVGVQFKLVPLTEHDFVSSIPATALDNRSRLAHVCFGTNQLRAIASQPNSEEQLSYGLVDALYNDPLRLTECDVPLAVFQFQSNTLRFVDMWAVRRIALPAQHPQSYLNDPFSFYVSSRRPAEAAAFFLQFQDHLEDLRTNPTLTTAQVAGVVASQYFEYLPAAGYLPIQASSGDRRFRITSFFGTELPTQSLEPENLRLLFRDALYAEPIRPGIDEVDIYQVTGTPSNKPYRIFTRRTSITLVVTEPEEIPEAEPEETTPTVSTGDLYVAVLSTTGEAIAAEYIQSVQATNQSTMKTYTAQLITSWSSKSLLQKRYQSHVQKAQSETKQYYAIAADLNRVDDYAIAKQATVAYFFNNLPAGKYTIKANSAHAIYYGVTKSVNVRANIDNFTDVVIRKQSLTIPHDDIHVDDDYLSPDGIIFDGYWFDPRWPEFYPNWEEEVFEPGFGVIDPSPEDWILQDDPLVSLQLETLLRDIENPRVAMAGSEIYIRKDYDPAQPGETVTAFVQTQDGSRFPVIPLAADNALDKPATVDRTEILDFDRATVDRLGAFGLSGIDAFASAPTNLVAGILGQSVEYSASLIADVQTTLQEDFRNGYLSYPGITKNQSDALKAEFDSKVGLANASSDIVVRILGDVSSSFANRFLADVRITLPQEAFDLASTGIDASGQENLTAIGVSSNKAFLDRSMTEAGRRQLIETLGVSEATLDRYLGTAALGVTKGELMSTPEKSIGTLATIPSDLKASLVSAGIGSAKVLANANPNDLATKIGVSIAETTAIVDAAAPFGSHAHITLVTLATKGAITAETLAAAGLNSAGAIARADTATLEATGLDVTAAQTVKNLSSQLLSGESIRRFR
jgi:hypothetical protein